VVSQNHQDLPPDTKEKRRKSQFINFDVTKALFGMTFFQHTSMEIPISGEAAAYVIYFKKILAFGNCLFSQRHDE
jgi:hypothetical protein